MTEQEKLFVKMVNDIIHYLQKNRSIWESFPVIVRTVNDLIYEEGCIDSAWLKQEHLTTSGQTSDKYAQINETVGKAFRLARKLTFFAKDTKNVVLLEKVSVAESWFTADGESETFKRCSSIVTIARQYLGSTAEYGVTSEELAILEQTIARVSQLPAELAMITSERKAATQAIKTHSARAKEILSSLDDAFEGIIDDSAFVDAWFEMRKIKRRSKVKKGGSKQ